MENKRKILVIENQFTQFKKITKLLDTAGYQSFPDEETFKDYIDWIRIYLNPRYTRDRRDHFWKKILVKTIDFAAEVFIIDHILVGTHNAEDGIDLAMKFRENGITQPFIFFSRTDINSIDVCRRLPNVSPKKDWIFKGYSGAAILEPEFFRNEVIKKIEEFLNPSIVLPTVVILTAIQEEYLAVKSYLKEIKDADQDNTFYEEGIFELERKAIARVIIRECGAKNSTSSMETERAIRYFEPQSMFFVGIAGSRKPNDFAIGDVIVPEIIYSYEGGKSDENSFSARPDFGRITYSIKELAKKERGKPDWKKIIKGDWDKEVKADLGIIASGEKIIEHYDSYIGKILTNHYDDTQAVEMEGFGFTNTAIQQGKKFSNMDIGVVRGISDILGQTPREGMPAEIDRRPENAKKLASNTAAAFAFWLIFKTYAQ